MSARHAYRSKSLMAWSNDRGRTVVRRGSDKASIGTGRGGGAQAIPPTLQQSLMARLDRLGEAREDAQIAAVIGREFSYPLIRAVTEMEDPWSTDSPGTAHRGRHLLVRGLAPN